MARLFQDIDGIDSFSTLLERVVAVTIVSRSYTKRRVFASFLFGESLSFTIDASANWQLSVEFDETSESEFSATTGS